MPRAKAISQKIRVSNARAECKPNFGKCSLVKALECGFMWHKIYDVTNAIESKARALHIFRNALSL